jgi:hypothetical protein
MLATSGGFSNDGGARESYRAILLRELRLELVRLRQLRMNVSTTRW